MFAAVCLCFPLSYYQHMSHMSLKRPPSRPMKADPDGSGPNARAGGPGNLNHRTGVENNDVLDFPNIIPNKDVLI